MVIPAIVPGLFFLAVLFLSIPVDLAFSYERGEVSGRGCALGGCLG